MVIGHRRVLQARRALGERLGLPTRLRPFDVARSQAPVERFVAHVLVGAPGARALVVGAHAACGHQRFDTGKSPRRAGLCR
jgi:FAD synthase